MQTKRLFFSVLEKLTMIFPLDDMISVEGFGDGLRRLTSFMVFCACSSAVKHLCGFYLSCP